MGFACTRQSVFFYIIPTQFNPATHVYKCAFDSTGINKVGRTRVCVCHTCMRSLMRVCVLAYRKLILTHESYA